MANGAEQLPGGTHGAGATGAVAPPDPVGAGEPRGNGRVAWGVQQEMPFALVQGAPLLSLPQDLYIPPDALEIFLDAFEGPLDLLLYLIKRQNLDILDIPIASITDQYMEYVDLMKGLKLELAAEYLVMAAMLAEIKSRMLLPRPSEEGDDEEDPRAELIRRLQEYERFKQAAQDLDGLPRLERDVFAGQAEFPSGHIRRIPPEVDLRERMSLVLGRLQGGGFVGFASLFDVTEGRAGVVVTFLAIPELIKAATLELVQSESFAPIHVRLREDPRAGAAALADRSVEGEE